MAKTISILPPGHPSLDTDFIEKVDDLVEEVANLKVTVRVAAEAMLKFAKRFQELSAKAHELDKNSSTANHAEHLNERLEEAIGTKNRAIHSQWNTIGLAAPKLLGFASSLPAGRESLYQVALAEKDNLPITQWVKDESLTQKSAVRELKALRMGKSRKKKPKHKPRQAIITLVFATYGEAADVLEEAFKSSVKFKVRASTPVAFKDAMKEKLGRDRYGKQEYRFR